MCVVRGRSEYSFDCITKKGPHNLGLMEKKRAKTSKAKYPKTKKNQLMDFLFGKDAFTKERNLENFYVSSSKIFNTQGISFLFILINQGI